MTRIASLYARQGEDAQSFSDVEVALFIFSHPDLDEPLRISTDNRSIIEHTPQGPVYGTYSSWQTPGGEPFLFVGVSAILPGDDEEAPPVAQLGVENVSSKIAETLHLISGRAPVDVAMIYASRPDEPEAEWIGMKMMESGGDAGLITIDLSYDFIGDEPWPAQRQTRQRFPGMHP